MSPGVVAPKAAILVIRMASKHTPSSDKKPQHSADSIDIDALPVVQLTDWEYKVAEYIAAVRYLTYKSIDGGDVYGDQSAYEAQLKGVMGEIAAATYLDGTSIYDIDALHERGDGGYDLLLKGSTVDVKASGTDLDVPDLIVPADPPPRADTFVLAHRIGEKTVRLVGSAPKRQVKQAPVYEFPGNRKNHFVPADELVTFDN